MPLATSYPNQHALIVQSDITYLDYTDNQGVSMVVGLLPLVDGTVRLSLEDDNILEVPLGVAYPVIAGVPIVGRISRIWSTGTTLTNAQMYGLLITRG